MPSLFIVGYGEKNIQNFVEFLQTELKTFIKQNNVCIYNSDTLWKAEAIPDRLKRNARVTLPWNKEATCSYLGFFNVNDWDALYSTLFSSAKTDYSDYRGTEYYSLSRLKTLINYFADNSSHNGLKKRSEKHFYDFGISYCNEIIDRADRACIIEIEIDSSFSGYLDFFHHILYELDSRFPDVFLSAYIGDSDYLSIQFIYDKRMLTKRIIGTDEAFYMSNNLLIANNVTDVTMFRQYNASRMKNGTWFVLQNTCEESNASAIEASDLLIPQYTLTNWSDLLAQKHLRIGDIDTISVYDNGYLPTNPILMLSRGYTSKQLYDIAQEHGNIKFLARIPINSLLSNS